MRRILDRNLRRTTARTAIPPVLLALLCAGGTSFAQEQAASTDAATADRKSVV